ncbi:MAG: heme o synthase, partial [Candidatus Hodarchaeales archaeon]
MAKINPTDQLQVSEGTQLVTFTTIPFFLYGDLIKSKQTLLLVYTTFFAYLITAWSSTFDLSVFLWLIVGVFFAISGSTLLNMYIDRDIDSIMERTKNRALPSGKVPPSTVQKHGFLFTFAGILAVGFFVNLLTMVVVFLGAFFDVVIYSYWLKRRTRYSIIFGGIAGGLPALAGITAVTGSITPVGVMMALFVLCWIPLHILTLALLPKNLRGYRNANVPMWPVVRSEVETILVITLSAVLSAVLVVMSGIALKIDLVLMIPLLGFNLFILFQSLKNFRNPCPKRTFKIFKMASVLMAFAFFWLF